MTVQQENILQVKESYEEHNMERITATYPDVFQGHNHLLYRRVS